MTLNTIEPSGKTPYKMRIGLISDTHTELEDGSDLPKQVLETLTGLDLIIHCGDLDTLGVLDRLEEVAPVLAVRGYRDPRDSSDRLAESTRVIEAGGLSIGVIHDIRWPGIKVGLQSFWQFPDTPMEEILTSKFGKYVDIVAFGDTHEETVAYHQGVMLVNPGSPTRPGLRHPKGEMGTLGILEIRDKVAAVELVKLKGWL